MTKLIGLVAGVALAGGAALALAQENPAGEERGRRGREGRNAASFIERYDTDKDGKVDAQELEAGRAAREQEMKAQMLERFDANKNGVLDPEEKETAREQFRGRRGGHHGRGHHQRMLERFDANKNGVMDPEEKEAARAEVQQRRAAFVKRFDTNGDRRLTHSGGAA